MNNFDEWPIEAQQEVTRLRKESAAYRIARNGLKKALEAARAELQVSQVQKAEARRLLAETLTAGGAK